MHSSRANAKNHQAAATRVAIASGGYWTDSRRHRAGLTTAGESVCRTRGTGPATALRVFWRCPRLLHSGIPEVLESQHLLPRVDESCLSFGCRGLVPHPFIPNLHEPRDHIVCAELDSAGVCVNRHASETVSAKVEGHRVCVSPPLQKVPAQTRGSELARGAPPSSIQLPPTRARCRAERSRGGRSPSFEPNSGVSCKPCAACNCLPAVTRCAFTRPRRSWRQASQFVKEGLTPAQPVRTSGNRSANSPGTTRSRLLTSRFATPLTEGVLACL